MIIDNLAADKKYRFGTFIAINAIAICGTFAVGTTTGLFLR